MWRATQVARRRVRAGGRVWAGDLRTGDLRSSGAGSQT